MKNSEISLLKEYIYPNGVYRNTRSNSASIKKRFPVIYESIKDNYHTKIYILCNDIKEIPKCKNPSCNNNVSLKNIGAGFRDYCSKKCLGEHQKVDKKFAEKISKTITRKCNEKLEKKYNLKIKHSIKDKNFYTINDYCTHSPFDIYRSVFNKLYTQNKCLCIKCNEELVNNYKPSKNEIKKFQKESPLFYKKYSLTLNKKWFLINFPKEYKIILTWSKHITDASLSERIFLFRNEMKKRPLCEICNKRELIYKSSYEGYTRTCTSPSCYKNSSLKEIEVYNFLKKINLSTTHKHYINGTEYDIIVKNKNLLIEFNGLYWHSDKFKEKNYHFNKYKLAKENGYDLVIIWEDDWNHKQDIIKSILNYKVYSQKININGRECIIKEIKDTKKFLNENHLQGWCQSSINLGLYYNNELVSLMTFGKRSLNKLNEYELLRFCNKINTNVRGGASKLFKYFIKNFNANKIISYASCDYSNGNLYKILGFKEIRHTGINYWWADSEFKYHRSNFMKYKLVKEGYDSNKTENEIMRERDFYKIYGVGNLKYEKNLQL